MYVVVRVAMLSLLQVRVSRCASIVLYCRWLLAVHIESGGRCRWAVRVGRGGVVVCGGVVSVAVCSACCSSFVVLVPSSKVT